MKRPFALSVVVPVYNGGASIGELVGALRALDLPGGLEVVLVNDGSADDSFEVCRGLAAGPGAPVTLVDLSRNYGEHNAVMAGLAHARGDYTITMDDDLQNPPEEVRRLYEHARDNDYDVVYTHYATKEHAAWRNIGSRFTNWCADRLIAKPRGLYLSSFRCISAFLRERLVSYDGPYPYVDGLIFQITENVGRLQVTHLPRAEGRSNYTLRRLLRLWLSMFLNFSVMPLRFASITGMVIAGLGIAGLIVVLLEALLKSDLPTGWASLMSTLALLAGVQLMILGVMGEYLGRMFLTANRKPQYLVRRIYLRDGERLVTHEPAAGSAAAGRPYAGVDRAHVSPVENVGIGPLSIVAPAVTADQRRRDSPDQAAE
jgi:undecaprenyl-phosphate 4-deoxy-4-formamido-L-arabinose transferase